MEFEYSERGMSDLFMSLFNSLTFVATELGERSRTPSGAFSSVGLDALGHLSVEFIPALSTAWSKSVVLQEHGPGSSLLASEIHTYCSQTAPWTGYGRIDNRDPFFKNAFPDPKPEPPELPFLRRMSRIAATLIGSVLEVLGDHLSAKLKAVLDVLKEIFEILGD